MTSSEREYYLSPEFLRNLKAAGKAYAGKQQAQDFKTVIEEVIAQIMADPLAVVTTGASGVVEWRGPEGSPGFFDTQVDSRFFKAYFKVPHMKGAAAQGRVMYMVQEGTLIVDFLMYYTHAEFQGRPPDKYLKHVFSEAGVPRDESNPPSP